VFEVVNLDQETRKVAFSTAFSGIMAQIQTDRRRPAIPDPILPMRGRAPRRKTCRRSTSAGAEWKSSPDIRDHGVGFQKPSGQYPDSQNPAAPLYYTYSGRREAWQEFELEMPEMRLRR
jgi:hypothetical protein